jgi:glycosyltransferase involved in cell wall biosynthesis
MRIQPRPWSAKSVAQIFIEKIHAKLPDRISTPIEAMVRRVYNTATPSKDPSQNIDKSDEFFLSLDADVVHFPTQRYKKTNLPTVYNPHDLQHLHLPNFFDEDQIQWREWMYRNGCDDADAIAVASDWVKSDIVESYHIPEHKVHVISLSAPTSVYESDFTDSDEPIRSKYDLPDQYCFYPAQTWPHKNHLRLLEAIAHLRDEKNLRVNLVCTGKKNDHWTTIKTRIEELKLGTQVFFLGFINEEYLQRLYANSLFTVIPTLFEAASFPMYEAWHQESPVACSNVTSLPDIAGDAALLFDPESVHSIANAVERMTTDQSVRKQLKQRANERLHELSWKKTAYQYELLYRYVSGNDLSDGEMKHINSSLKNNF